MPTVIMSWLSDTSAPRCAGGAVSARYSGVSIEATPMPTPTRNRPMISTERMVAMAETMAPTKKITATTRMTVLRPNWSARGPATMAPMAAPPSATLVSTPSISGVSAKTFCRKGRAPEITPVS
jgi:hypothetical protein